MENALVTAVDDLETLAVFCMCPSYASIVALKIEHLVRVPLVIQCGSRKLADVRHRVYSEKCPWFPTCGQSW